MPVVGAVLTLRPGHPLPAELADPRITLGDRVEDRVPFVLVTERARDDRDLLELLEASTGVDNVLVAFVDQSDLVEVSP